MLLRGLAEFAMKGYWQAALIIAAMSSLALALPPASYLASAVIALGTLRAGPKDGFIIIGFAAVFFALAAAFLFKQPYLVAVFALVSWLPVYGMTLILGFSRSLALSLLVAAGIGLVMIMLTYLLVADPATWWLEVMAPFVEMLQAEPDWQLDEAQTQAFASTLAGMMTGLIVAGLYVNVVLGLLLGRSWQAALYNPGGFAEEFQQLNLGKLAAVITALVAIVAAIPGEGFAFIQDCLPILLVLLALQGVAVVHAVVRQGNRHTGWLIAMYILLLIMMPQMVFLLALIGVSDQWFNFRQRSIGQGE